MGCVPIAGRKHQVFGRSGKVRIRTGGWSNGDGDGIAGLGGEPDGVGGGAAFGRHDGSIGKQKRGRVVVNLAGGKIGGDLIVAASDRGVLDGGHSIRKVVILAGGHSKSLRPIPGGGGKGDKSRADGNVFIAF